MAISQDFLDALVSPQPAPELADADDIFDFLIGSWELDAVLYDAEGHTQKSSGELHVSWVLEGRAIQDYSFFRDARIGGLASRLGATDMPPQSERLIERCKRGASTLSILRLKKLALS